MKEVTMTIDLDTVNAVKNFVNDIRTLEGEFDLLSGKYVVDAKSIMGIFSLDLSVPLTLRVKAPDEENLHILEKYVHKEN